MTRKQKTKRHLRLGEWQADGIKRAIASLDRGEGISHKRVKNWVESWGRKAELIHPTAATPPARGDRPA
jgi:predicted transcriptional regulator